MNNEVVFNVIERNAPTGRELKASIRTFKARTLMNQSGAIARDGIEAADYIIDLFVDNTLEQLDDETLERVVQAATANNLRTLGYTGARSNSGRTITTIHTALIHAVEKEFGSDAVYSKGGWETNFRGIRNTAEIRRFYCDEVQRLIRGLLTKV